MPSKVRNSLLWILEPLEGDETYFRKRMFGRDAAYVDGLLCWSLLTGMNRRTVCSYAHPRYGMQPLYGKFRLRRHLVLGKWLCVKQSDPAFEDVARRVVSLVCPAPRRAFVVQEGRVYVAAAFARIKCGSLTSKALVQALMPHRHCEVPVRVTVNSNVINA